MREGVHTEMGDGAWAERRLGGVAFGRGEWTGILIELGIGYGSAIPNPHFCTDLHQ